ncbi:MAG: DUF4446 family protein [Agathobacter sp.]|nr:DUF4446 family protein [Agathobacter sp.]
MISELLGFDSDYIIIGLAVFCLILLILVIVNMTQTNKLKKKYKSFMSGKSAKSLEDTLIARLQQVDKLLSANEANEQSIKTLFANMKFTFQKVGLVKYDAFDQMGGKLSFSLALLNESEDGFVLNAVHSREGCYTYVKEIVGGNSVITLAEEEQEALRMAKESNKAK